MKNLSNYLLILFFAFFVSCSNENFEEVIPDPTGTNEDNPTPDIPPNTGTTPCDFDLTSIVAGETKKINCILDLKGKTVNLPDNVTLEFDKGDIRNGKIVFASDGKIAGELLNSTLTLDGGVTLINPTFKFFASRWDIIEGQTTSDIALENNKKFESLMMRIKELEGSTFEIDKFDAYFEVSKVTSTTSNQNFYHAREAINVPSDFTLRMTDNSHFRVQPNSRKNYALLSIRKVSNFTLEGGNFHGDRPEHDDNSQPGPHAFGVVIMIVGSNNILVDGAKMSDGIGDGMHISGYKFTFDPNYLPSTKIKVTNCTFKNNRRNNLSITDGFDMLIDGNTFIDAGVDNPNSEGMSPGVGIDIEANRTKKDGEFILYEKAYDITLSNNIERGSRHGAIILAISDDIRVENNTTEGVIAIGASSGIKIDGNKIIANPDNKVTGSGITTGHPASQTTFNNVISNNTIRGYNIGIAAYQRDTEIFGNTIEDFGVGIQPKDIKNYKIYNNVFNSDKPSSVAIFGNLTDMDNVNIYGNTVKKVGRESIKFVAVNEDTDAAAYKITVQDNDFDHSATFSRSSGIDFIKNRINEGLIFVNAKNMSVSQNTIRSSGRDGIVIQEGCSNLNIELNNITVIGNNLDCINQKSAGSNITINANNTCAN